MNILNRLPCSAVSHVIPSVDNFNKIAIPVIMVMQPLYGAVLIYILYEIISPIVKFFVLFTSYCYIFLLVVVFVFSHSSILVLLVIGSLELTKKK